MKRTHCTATLTLLVSALLLNAAPAAELELKPGDHVCYIGNTTADRMQHDAWLETYLYATFPNLDLTFRNLGFPGDEINVRSRSNNFGDPNQWLTKCQADVVFCFFGYNEALRGEAGVNGFTQDLAGMIDAMRAQKYNGKSPPRLVVFSPIAHENLHSPHLPDGSKNNHNLTLYTDAMRKVCDAKEVVFVDLFQPTQKLYASAAKRLTMNGIHLLDHGNKAVAKVIMQRLFPTAAIPGDTEIETLRDAVLDKNYYWFSRYRVVDGYNVYGGRSRLAWHGQSNADVMRREMEIFDVLTANRDRRVWAVVRGGDLKVKDDNLPAELAVKPNKIGPLEGGRFPYLDPVDAMDKMKVAEGMEINLFASEKMFPRLINPVQVAVDTNSRLWASVWPSYPHWNPTQPRKDALVILPDEDEDGVADDCIVFADELNSVTGFEFWGGGVLVFAPPELWFLKDTDGDDKADVKIRMLQGVSSADTHHSANAVVVGPDGWLYWSRGIFNVANFETPTQLYRSGQSGVHRFNPRTFEVEFHFPIGPNPHGDVIDQWGYQFANDGTSGTGSYINIGKGMGNKQWFQKRVRPVPATGILSSSHFPEENNGNFLICNAIGFLGVLQHKVQYNGADITATEVEPIVVSTDPNFRPSDVEVGGDGALYIADWHNTLIGHMQHNMRDPNRDHIHGRIYRVTAKGRPLLKPAKMNGKPVAEVCENFFAHENSTRYRARLELTRHDAASLLPRVQAFASKLSPANAAKERDEAQALLECLWVFEEQRVPNPELLSKVFQAAEPRVRAAAIRTLGHWAGRVDGWEPTLLAAGRDGSALVRAEALKAAVEFSGSAAAAEVIFAAAALPMDPELSNVFKYARSKINVDAMIAESIKSGQKLSPAATAYALQQASPAALLQMERSEAVYGALVSRAGIPASYRWEAVAALAKSSQRSATAELIARIGEGEAKQHGSLGDLAQMLATVDPDQAAAAQRAVASLASTTESTVVRKAAYRAWLRAGGAREAWDHAVKSRAALTDLLSGIAELDDAQTRQTLFPLVRPLASELPKHLRSDDENGVAVGSGPAVSFDYYQPNSPDAAIETLDKRKPTFSGKIPGFTTFVPNGVQDAFSTRQAAAINVPASGKYTFFVASDDGSRLYIDKQQVVNNDGLHGMVEKQGDITLSAGLHDIVVTYFDNGGGDGLVVSWQGPVFSKQPIASSSLRPVGSGSLQAIAINVLGNWPGHLDEKVADLARLAGGESMKVPALNALSGLRANDVADRLSPEVARDVLGAVIEQADQATPVERQSTEFSRLLDLGGELVAKAEADESIRKLQALRASIPVQADPAVMALGKEIYSRHSHCATCHQPHGQGLPNLYPPLDGSLWATGSEDRMIRIVLDGMHGTIDVKGRTYSSPPLPPMTGFRQLLNDQEVAAVLTYVRNSWSNRARPIDAQKVAEARKEDRGDAVFWYANDLLKRFPLEDGRKPIESSTGGWVPKFVKKWTPSDFSPSDLKKKGRSFETGQVFFKRLGCAQCHQIKGAGGSFGPDLARLEMKKRQPDYVLQSIIDPSKDVDEKYSVRLFVLDSGKVVTGLVVAEKPDAFHVITDPLAPNRPTIVAKDDIDEESKTKASIMPQGLLNWLTHDEVLDLVAYVLAAGDARDERFSP